MRDSQFDPLKLRYNLWSMASAGNATIKSMSCDYAKVIWIQPHGQGIEPLRGQGIEPLRGSGAAIEPPWDDWSRVFQWISYPPEGKWIVYWFPAHIKRVLPPRGHEVGPQNINGGYCFPCNPQSIVVYRYEESTRVLLHELLHAACLDPVDADLPMKEATTETWAELLLVALCSKGDVKAAKHFWRLQSQWIANQNDLLRKQYHVKTMEDYAWRYTLGRETILTNLRISLPPPFAAKGSSSRLTHPALCA